jgi:aldehyde:ferredoxin oxidoreductase
VIQAEYLCDLYGLDSISTGSTIGFLMECFEKGLLAESEIGFPLAFGDHRAMIKAVHLIGRAQGPGRLWGQGTRRLGEAIPGAAGAAMHVKGLELPAYDPRGSTGMALAFATSDRGGCHLRAWPIGAELLATENRMDPFSPEYKAEFVKAQQDLFTVLNSAVLCLFSFPGLSMKQVTRFLETVTGLEQLSSAEEILTMGERTNNLVRLFNLREGLTRADDRLPDRFSQEPLEEGPLKGRLVDLEPMMEEYYFCRGWDASGRPGQAKLEELGLTHEG